MLRAADEIAPPWLVRGDEVHAQIGIRLYGDRSGLLQGPEPVYPAAVSPLVDVRQGYRDSDPGSIFATYHHKMRVLVLGDRLRTKHVFFSLNPIVSSSTFTLSRYGWRAQPLIRSLLRWGPRLSGDEQAAVEADLAYWRQPCAHGDLMKKAVAALGLHAAAIDYSVRADGSVILWEANPYFFLPRLKDIMLPRHRLAEARLASYHDARADFLQDLADGVVSSMTLAPITPSASSDGGRAPEALRW